VRYVRGAETENRYKPDFLFPGIAEYKDTSFDDARLTLLGAKSTLKDRWRQVLAEANRINDKHLLTLEPRISENQTEEQSATAPFDEISQISEPGPVQSTSRRPTFAGCRMETRSLMRMEIGGSTRRLSMAGATFG
jgi:hypothetical protein